VFLCLDRLPMAGWRKECEGSPGNCGNQRWDEGTARQVDHWR